MKWRIQVISPAHMQQVVDVKLPASVAWHDFMFMAKRRGYIVIMTRTRHTA